MKASKTYIFMNFAVKDSKRALLQKTSYPYLEYKKVLKSTLNDKQIKITTVYDLRLGIMEAFKM